MSGMIRTLVVVMVFVVLGVVEVVDGSVPLEKFTPPELVKVEDGTVPLEKFTPPEVVKVEDGTVPLEKFTPPELVKVEDGTVPLEKFTPPELVKVEDGTVPLEKFTPPEVVKVEDGTVPLGITLLSIDRVRSCSSLFGSYVPPLLLSLLTSSSRRPITLLVITDPHSLQGASSLLRGSVSKVYTAGVVLRLRDRFVSQPLTIPPVTFVFVNIEELVRGEEDFIKEMKENTDTTIQTNHGNEKYFHDLFYIGPIYHRKFLQLTRIIFLDVDLIFHTDVQELMAEFSQLGSPGRCLAAGPDLSPHYRKKLGRHRLSEPESTAGDPGPLLQGLNTGVILYDLKCLRQSQVYNSHLEKGAVEALVKRFQMQISLGDQDWFSMLAWKEPGLFHPLACKWNYQNSVQYLLDPEMAPFFPKYHYCGLPHSAKIEHRNGCGPRVENCRAQVKVETFPPTV